MSDACPMNILWNISMCIGWGGQAADFAEASKVLRSMGDTGTFTLFCRGEKERKPTINPLGQSPPRKSNLFQSAPLLLPSLSHQLFPNTKTTAGKDFESCIPHIINIPPFAPFYPSWNSYQKSRVWVGARQSSLLRYVVVPFILLSIDIMWCLAQNESSKLLSLAWSWDHHHHPEN